MPKPLYTLVTVVIAGLIATTSSAALAQKPNIAPTEQGSPQMGLPKISLKAGSQTIKADIAATDETRQKGLMFRTKMGANEGMLFVFPQIGYHAMWMRNTLINLSVAYLDEEGKILSIHEMTALDETSHQSAGPARYALEMNAMWFTKNKVKVGDTIRGLDKAPKPK
jgi:uncharacterized protein